MHTHPWLADHAVAGRVLVPGTGLLGSPSPPASAPAPPRSATSLAAPSPCPNAAASSSR
ncbi:hypothetical protein O1M54_06470 [Streptomyces diastatochromogenes]|nr:hypothetical protein [Streptomyces diastatochromogenes]